MKTKMINILLSVYVCFTMQRKPYFVTTCDTGKIIGGKLHFFGARLLKKMPEYAKAGLCVEGKKKTLRYEFQAKGKWYTS